MAHYMPYAVPQYLRELGKGVATWRTTSHTHTQKKAPQSHIPPFHKTNKPSCKTQRTGLGTAALPTSVRNSKRIKAKL